MYLPLKTLVIVAQCFGRLQTSPTLNIENSVCHFDGCATAKYYYSIGRLILFSDERAKLCVDGHHTAEILKILRKVFRCVNHRTSVDPFVDRHCEKDAHILHTASVHILGLSAQKRDTLRTSKTMVQNSIF